MGESIGIDSGLEAKRCQARILPRCVSESSQELRVVLRDARLPNILRSAPTATECQVDLASNNQVTWKRARTLDNEIATGVLFMHN